MKDYDESVWTELAIKVLEGDIHFLARRYYIPGYDYDDLCQELRLQLLKKVEKYNPKISGIRAWANTVMRNRLSDLLKQQKREKRGGNIVFVPLDSCQYVEVRLEIDEFLDKLHENGKTLDDLP